jgi:3-hydroxyisobutyrate dehydrogenase
VKALQHFVKDMAIALEEAQRMQLALPGLALAQQLYTALVAQGAAIPPLCYLQKS